LCAALLAALPASADSVAQKRAEAQSVLNQVQQLDSSLERAIEAYNLATVKLERVRHELRQNGQELAIAKASLNRAQRALSARLVQLYTSGGQNSSLEVLLGASSLDDLLNRIDTVNRVSDQDARVLRQVVEFHRAVKAREAQLKKARAQAAALVAQRASARNSIQSQLSERRAMLSSIRTQISQMEAAERARELALRRELEARQAQQQQAAREQVFSSSEPVAAPSPSSSGSSSGGGSGGGGGSVGPAPPPTHSSVVAIAERYLGVPYRWGGASPSGFDCSGLVMYVFAQVGVSLPHSSYAQYGYGTPVSRGDLQPGDLVFFNGLGHVGIYVGGGSFIHAPHTGDVVKISSMTGWYASTFVGARRI
jgi:cell wall-associated NlpC family hydrolase